MMGEGSNKLLDISDVLYSDTQPMSDIFIVGLQEMVPLNTKEVIKKKNKMVGEEWEQILQCSLNNNKAGVHYIPVLRKVMVGCFIIMFIKEELKLRLKMIRKFKVQTGFSGMTGNKGAVALSFHFDNTAFAFINCHLESGQNALPQRLQNIR